MTEEITSQDQMNQAEWENPDNWGGTQHLCVYFSKKDKRVWVPKKKPSTGKTPNLAHKAGVFWFVGINVGIIVVLAAVTIAIAPFVNRLMQEINP